MADQTNKHGYTANGSRTQTLGYCPECKQGFTSRAYALLCCFHAQGLNKNFNGDDELAKNVRIMNGNFICTNCEAFAQQMTVDSKTTSEKMKALTPTSLAVTTDDMTSVCIRDKIRVKYPNAIVKEPDATPRYRIKITGCKAIDLAPEEEPTPQQLKQAEVHFKRFNKIPEEKW